MSNRCYNVLNLHFICETQYIFLTNEISVQSYIFSQILTLFMANKKISIFYVLFHKPVHCILFFPQRYPIFVIKIIRLEKFKWKSFFSNPISIIKALMNTKNIPTEISFDINLYFHNWANWEIRSVIHELKKSDVTSFGKIGRKALQKRQWRSIGTKPRDFMRHDT